MEAVPRLPMLCFELKSNPQKNAEFGPDLMNLIRINYPDEPSDFTNEIQSLEKLRQQAMNPTKDVEGCALLKRYFCQLYFLRKRFSMLQNGPSGNDASWKPSLPFMSRKTVDFRLEYTITMYNIGALHTQLGAADDRTTNEGLKYACTHFQCAAWAFKYLESINSMKSRADFDPGFFQFLIPLCLAQAQECIAEKSITDNRKPSISAKVAAQICEYYGQALNALTHGKQEELPIFDVNIKNSHVWINYVKYKKAYYECVSYLFMGMQSEEDEKWGERVAYFEASAEKLKVAVQHAKCVELPQLYKGLDEAMSFTRDVVEGKRKNAVSENDFIYHQEVPAIDHLPKIKGAVLVKCIEFDFSDPEISGPDIFGRLISLEVHQLSSVYSEKKALLLRSVSAAVEEKDIELVSFMQSLKLDFLNSHEDLNILPEELVERCAACEAKPNLIQDLNDAMDKLTQDQYQVDSLMKEVIKLIADEEKADADYHRIMGTNPQPSIVATELKCEANRYAEALKKATDSNESLRNAILAHVNNLHILSLPLEELEQHLPKVSTVFGPEDEAIVRELRRLVGKVDEMKNQRTQLIMKFRESLKDDDITQKLVLKHDDFDKMFGQEISKHQSVKNLIDQNMNAQTNILNALTNTYAAYAPIRKTIYENLQQRSTQINALIESFDVSDDVLKKASKGLEFYSKLEGNVRKLLSRLKGTCKVQEDNRMQMYDKTKKPLRTPSFTEAPSSTPKLKDYIGSYVPRNGTATTEPRTDMKNQIASQLPVTTYGATYASYGGYNYTQPANSYQPNTYPAPANQQNTYSTPSNQQNTYASPASNTWSTTGPQPAVNYAANNVASYSASQYPVNTAQYQPNYAGQIQNYDTSTTEPRTDTKNQIAASLPVTTYGSTYPSYGGYNYTQPTNSYQQNTYSTPANPQNTYATPANPQNTYATPANQQNTYATPANNTWNTAGHQPAINYAANNVASYNAPQYAGNAAYQQTNYPAGQYQNQYNYPMSNAQNVVDAQNKIDFTYVSVDSSTFNTSHYYTNAGHNNVTNIESTSKTLDGRSYVVQYATPQNDAASGNYAYYNNQYGYQYQNPKICSDTTEKFVPKVNDDGERLQAKRNSMTYMQASTINNGTTSTYSVNGNQSESKSNVDLLSTLDLNVSQTPLLPLPDSADNSISEQMQNLNVNSS